MVTPDARLTLSLSCLSNEMILRGDEPVCTPVQPISKPVLNGTGTTVTNSTELKMAAEGHA
jgi:hypothetical protein